MFQAGLACQSAASLSVCRGSPGRRLPGRTSISSAPAQLALVPAVLLAAETRQAGDS